MSKDQEQELLKIAKTVAKECRLEDKEEAFSIALLGMAKGLSSYTPNRGAKLMTYLYSCAKFECWAEWRKQHRVKRGNKVKIYSLEELEEGGMEF